MLEQTIDDTVARGEMVRSSRRITEAPPPAPPIFVTAIGVMSKTPVRRFRFEKPRIPLIPMDFLSRSFTESLFALFFHRIQSVFHRIRSVDVRRR